MAQSRHATVDKCPERHQTDSVKMSEVVLRARRFREDLAGGFPLQPASRVAGARHEALKRRTPLAAWAPKLLYWQKAHRPAE